MPTCNCRKDKICPLHGECLTPDIIYQAEVTRFDNNTTEYYVGLTANQFKTRYNTHTHSFRNKSKTNETTLSQHIWELKNNNILFSLNWKIIAKAKSYIPGDRVCNLCLQEKFYIIYKSSMATLNTRNELASKCKHRWKYLLENT